LYISTAFRLRYSYTYALRYLAIFVHPCACLVNYTMCASLQIPLFTNDVDTEACCQHPTYDVKLNQNILDLA